MPRVMRYKPLEKLWLGWSFALSDRAGRDDVSIWGYPHVVRD
jgi:hypothetical protein